MNLIENKTKFTHIGMPAWGVGTYIKSDGDYITIQFENAGVKKFSKASINAMLKIVGEVEKKAVNKSTQSQITHVPANEQNGSLVQYDGEHGGIAGKNVIEAFEGNDSVIFNETYIIVGKHTEALKIHAMYDLTIMGDVTVQECVVNGSLTVIGNARIKSLNCYNGFICKGDLYSDKIYVGGDMIVDSIVCDELICDGNVAIRTTVNINQNAKIAKTMFACEGIMGAGKFSALNAIANEYFEFDGDYEGKIVELEMDTTINDSIPVKVASAETIEEIIKLANQKLVEEYGKCPELDEEQIVEHLRGLSAIENKELKALPVIEHLFSRLAEMSYKDKIETVEDYITVLVAQNILPGEVYSYESIDHIGKLYLPKAQDEVEKLSFEPTSIQQFAKVLSMAVQLEEELSDDWELIMDKLFESIGLKYATVSSMIKRNKPKKTIEEPIQVEATLDTLKEETAEQQQEPKPGIPRMKKEDFLAKKLSHSGKKFGLTDVELERMATIKVRTFGDLIKTSDATLTKVFGKKAFLASQLIQTRDKIIERLADME